MLTRFILTPAVSSRVVLPRDSFALSKFETRIFTANWFCRPIVLPGTLPPMALFNYEVRFAYVMKILGILFAVKLIETRGETARSVIIARRNVMRLNSLRWNYWWRKGSWRKCWRQDFPENLRSIMKEDRLNVNMVIVESGKKFKIKVQFAG